MDREANVKDVRYALRARYPYLEEDVSTRGADHPVEAILIVLLSVAFLGTTSVPVLVRFTGYPKQFLSAIAFNMQNNRLWVLGHYDSSEWFNSELGIVDDHQFWAHHEIASGLAWRPNTETISVDPCKIYWNELR